MKTITNTITSIVLTLSMLIMVGCQLTPEQRLEPTSLAPSGLLPRLMPMPGTGMNLKR
jgi:hypothetical protein